MKDLHTHTTFSDGKNTPEEMVQAAIRAGLTEYGISDHGYTPFDASYCMPQSRYGEYRAALAGLREKYKGQISLRLGMEQDFYSVPVPQGLDYVIGSVHYLRCGDAFVPVDEDAAILRGAVSRYFGGDPYALCEQYARPLVTAVPVFFLNFLLYDFVRCDNDAPRATLGFSVGCLTDLGLNIWFVLGLGWGVKGSIYATVIAQSVSVIILLTHLINGRGLMNIPRIVKAKLAIGKPVADSLRIGFSASMQYVFQFLFLLLGNRVLLRAGDLGLIKGDLYVAVFDVVMNISYIFNGIYQAFAETMQPLASTFAAEHGRDDLKYLVRMAMATALMVGIPVLLVAAIPAGAVSSFFGLGDAESLKVSVPAIRLFLLSTPLGGLLVILTGFFQSCGREQLAGEITVMRKALFLLPITVALGFWLPNDFWWLFVISEGITMIVLATAVRGRLIRKQDATVPVYSTTMDNQNHELSRVLDEVVAFCEEQEIPMKQAILIQLAVEELSVVTMEKAFSGRPDEYIQLTLAQEENGDHVIHIRNSAPYFNPLDLRMGKVQKDETDELMDSVGVMMVRQKVKSLHYRNYEGFNMMTVVI